VDEIGRLRVLRLIPVCQSFKENLMLINCFQALHTAARWRQRIFGRRLDKILDTDKGREDLCGGDQGGHLSAPRTS
jgi:hypothetical protein